MSNTGSSPDVGILSLIAARFLALSALSYKTLKVMADQGESLAAINRFNGEPILGLISGLIEILTPNLR